MFICRRCLIHRATTASQIPRHFQSTSVPRTGKPSRLDELIILDTPKSTRQPKKTTKKRPIELQRRLLDEYERNKSLEQGTREEQDATINVAGTEEINQYLDSLKIKYGGQALTPQNYTGLATQLRSGFTVMQLRAYLAHSRHQNVRREQRGLSTIILEDIWKVTSREYVKSSVGTTSIKLESHSLHFLLRNGGELLQSWLRSSPGKLEIDKKDMTLTITGTKKNRAKLTDSVDDLVAAILSKSIQLDSPISWAVDKDIMLLTDTFIEKTADGLRISYLAGQQSAATQAERHIRASLQLYSPKTMTSIVGHDADIVDTRIHTLHGRIVERNFAWTRSMLPITGVSLPFYYLNSTDPKPLKAIQVQARPKRQSFDAQTELSDGRTLRSLIESNNDAGELNIRFGMVLQDFSVGTSTFSTDIANQFRSLNHLIPNASAQDLYHMTLERHDERTFVQVMLPLHSDVASKEYTVTKMVKRAEYVQCPSQPSDLEISFTTKEGLSACKELDDLLGQSNLSRNEHPMTVYYEGQLWNVHLEMLTIISFSLPGNADSEGTHIEWRKIRSRETGENRQETRIVCETQAAFKDINFALEHIMEALHR